MDAGNLRCVKRDGADRAPRVEAGDRALAATGGAAGQAMVAADRNRARSFAELAQMDGMPAHFPPGTSVNLDGSLA